MPAKSAPIPLGVNYSAMLPPRRPCDSILRVFALVQIALLLQNSENRVDSGEFQSFLHIVPRTLMSHCLRVCLFVIIAFVDAFVLHNSSKLRPSTWKTLYCNSSRRLFWTLPYTAAAFEPAHKRTGDGSPNMLRNALLRCVLLHALVVFYDPTLYES